MSEDKAYHDDVPPPPYQRIAPSTSRQDPQSFTSTSNTLDSSSSWSITHKGKIDISLKLKEQDKSQDSLGDLQYGITPDVREYAIDPNGNGAVPPLNIVVFYLGDEFGLIPLLTIALELFKTHSHRVRISTQEGHRDTIMRYEERLYGLNAIDGEGLGEGLEDHLEIYDALAGSRFSLKSWSDVSSLAGGLKKMGYPAIVTIKGMKNTGQLPLDVFVLEDQEAASWLYSSNKVSAIIYDGNSYLATLAIKYSAPSIAITLSTGDMYWLERLSHLGASPRPMTLSQVTVESLSVALDEALSPERKVIATVNS
ncbi:hypothetical protein L486_01168 [Kwoniella mangroviensis CBS 10435]|uniref:Uncharacterized protein n=1 Tax=Kwoniella mangroviensis CBS 10435 TaxID=1331196 RepID=A0A1B9J155_9TREE|nr:hypothetical protein L486_01168 [Kwoniella mangroviensis CBS 10435]